MKSIFLISFLCLSVTTCINGQGSGFWETGNQTHGQLCTKSGILGIWPGLRCKTQGGSEYCKANGMGWGICQCNQGASALPRQDAPCVGLVGAICTSEKPSFIPAKQCTENAYCKPEQGDGYSVGRCECLHGYKEGDTIENAGECIPDEGIPEADREPPRTTTTTEAPDRGPFQLPINLLIGVNFAPFGQECHPKAMLKKTYCNTHGGTVSCVNRRCQCNMDEDSVFDQDLNMCVGRAGGYCLNKRSLFGYKVCTSGADCVVEQGEGYSLGVCQCMRGYDVQPDGTCVRDVEITDPETARPIIPTTTTEAPTTTPAPGDDSGVGAFSAGFMSITILAAIAVLQV